VDYKAETRKAYDTYPAEFEERFSKNFVKFGKREVDAFAQALETGRVLDLGSGPGVYASYLAGKGFDVFCADISEKMVQECRRKGLTAQVMDAEHLSFPPESFDGVLAIAVLLHLPRDKVPAVVENIARILKPRGLLLATFREGGKAGFEESDVFKGVKRFFTYFSEAEVRELFANRFECLRFTRELTVDGKTGFINFLFRRRN